MSNYRNEVRIGHPEFEPGGVEVYRVENLSYTYPEMNRRALDGISFRLNRNEVLGVVGRSGSGKTTLLNTLSGVIPHFYKGGDRRGSVTYNGAEVGDTELMDLMSQIGIVFQNPGLQSFGMPVDNALAFGMENLARERREMLRRVPQVADQLRIRHLLGRSSLGLSGGEAQALAVGSMLAMDPEVLLFDEVISALDAGGQQRMKGIITDLRDRGSTMVVVDSDIEWLSGTVDRLLVLEEGQIAYDGDPVTYRDAKRTKMYAGMDFRETYPTAEAVRVRDVTFGYDPGRPAVENVSFTVEKGKCTALVGHNGSGKSTMAKIMAGILRPQRGSVEVAGKPVTSLQAEEAVRQVGYLFQNPAQMFVTDTVRDELAFTPSQRGESSAVTPTDLGLEGWEDANPFDLSAGMQQRLALGCVLSVDPQVVILDEPTLGQTRADRESLTRLIADLEQRGRTVILISHDMEFVARTARDVHILDHGRLVCSGSAAEVMADTTFFTNLGLPLPWQNNT